MNKIDSQSASPTLSMTSTSTLESARWLIVLVPNVEVDLTPATRRVWELANAGGKRVRLIGLYENTMQELSLRRQMAGMSGMMGSAGIYTETEAISGRNWIEAVRSRWQAGDLVVCFGEQRVGSLKRSLSQVLQSSLDVPIYVLSGTYLQKGLRSSLWTHLFAWTGFMTILPGFFLIQVRIHQITDGWVRLALVLTSICLEIWMLWVWNRLFS
jgi:hypothetical protein